MSVELVESEHVDQSECECDDKTTMKLADSCDSSDDHSKSNFLQAAPDVSATIEVISRNGWGRWFFLLVGILGLGNAGDAVEVSCVRYILTSYRGPHGEKMTEGEEEFLGAAVFAGMLVGGLLVGFASDRLGRRPCFIFSMATAALAGFLCACAPTVSFLILTRVIAGLGIGGSIPVTFTLCMELTPPSKRGFYINVVAWNWMVGSLYVASMAWWMLGSLEEGESKPDTTAGHPSSGTTGSPVFAGVAVWRWFAFICALPTAVAATLGTLFVPETPQFLQGRNQMEQVTKVLRRIAKGCTKGESDEFRQHIEALGYHSVNSPTTSPKSTTHTYSQRPVNTSSPPTGNLTAVLSNIKAMGSPQLLRTSLTLGGIWFSLCYGFYGISTWITMLFQRFGMEHPYWNSLLFAGAQLPGNMLAAALIDTVPRRVLLGGSMLISTVFSMLLATGKKSFVVLAACLFNGISTIGWNTLDCVSVEFFPTALRTTAVGMLAASGRMGSIGAQFVNGALQDNVTVMLLVTTVFMFCAGVLSFALPKKVAVL
eukprot:TRINITY_DN66167_c6_g1_i1.p1 TRINITY_DN66167_c6_g1~~TRINITY_DN66167_c6_g1_i1.p1  ORF type:complete len:541 (-),score=10.68 TRINITY_DN66167_c6_g1_i1:619-2241(-)